MLPSVIIVALIMASCSNQAEEKRRKDLDEFNAYVQEHVNASEKYADQKWDDMDREFNEKKSKLENDKDKMNQEMKQKYDRIVADWESYKADHTTMNESHTDNEHINQFRVTLFPEGVRDDLSTVTPQNIAMVYTHFVNIVVKNKDTYTKEEWEAVDNSWKALNDKEDLYEKQITKVDDKTIFKQKVRYESIKVENKPFAKKEG
jgi:hypothetical protein